MSLTCKETKTVWGSPVLDFLGITCNGSQKYFTVAITQDRKSKLIFRANAILHNDTSTVLAYDQFHGCAMSSSALHWPLKAILRNVSLFISYCVNDLGLEGGYVEPKPMFQINKLFLKAMEHIKETRIDNIFDYKYLLESKYTTYDYVVYTDATRIAATFIIETGDWSMHVWPEARSHIQIAWGEAVAVLMGLLTYKDMFKGKRIYGLLITDQLNLDLLIKI